VQATIFDIMKVNRYHIFFATIFLCELASEDLTGQIHHLYDACIVLCRFRSTTLGPHPLPLNGKEQLGHSTKHLLLCSTE